MLISNLSSKMAGVKQVKSKALSAILAAAILFALCCPDKVFRATTRIWWRLGYRR